MPAPSTRPYLFYSATTALCSICLRRVEAKEVIEDDGVYLLKRCPEHGRQRVLLADDVAYWRRAREVFLKRPEQVKKYNTAAEYGCPYDCGICPEHEQHGCVSILEITDSCNLTCPTCYAQSGPHRSQHRSLETILRMLDRVCANEVEPDVVQISGGEPTLHPQFFEILDACRQRPIRHLMLNTNGIRIAKDAAFAERLSQYMPGFEVYLQFDSLQLVAHETLRGADLRHVRRQALERLEQLGISTTLVATVRKGLNDHELGALVEHALSWNCVRGVTFQPVHDEGRNEGYDVKQHRLTLTEVRRKIAEQTTHFSLEDIIPVPCHPDCLAMAYGLRNGSGGLSPLTRHIPSDLLLQEARSTISYEKDEAFRAALFNAFSTAHGPQGAAQSLQELLCCLPQVQTQTISYKDVFRIIIMQFLDRHSLDMRSVRKSCVHIAHPDGKRVMPFDTYNIFYRDDLERTRLAPLRQRLP